MLKIEILGTGCPNCRELEKNANKALEENRSNAEIIKITDINIIISYGVMSTPAIVIDGEVKSFGKVASVEEIMQWL